MLNLFYLLISLVLYVAIGGIVVEGYVIIGTVFFLITLLLNIKIIINISSNKRKIKNKNV